LLRTYTITYQYFSKRDNVTNFVEC